MKRTLITLFLIAFAIKTFSQDYKFSAELNFPYPFDNNFIADNYDGIIGFVNSKKITVGISINMSYLRSNS